MKAKIKSLPKRRTLVNALDSVFGLYIKLRDRKLIGGCPFHLHPAINPIEHVFHFITRSKHSVRWDPRNAVGSCAGCNIRYEHDQGFMHQVFEWYKANHGKQAWEDLIRCSNVPAKFSRTDLAEMLRFWKEALENHPPGIRHSYKVYGAKCTSTKRRS